MLQKLICRFCFVLPTLFLGFTACNAQTFGFTTKEIIIKFNNYQKTEGGDTLTQCHKTSEGILCYFTHFAFDKAVKALKEINVINGVFEDQGKALFQENNGKVSSIVVAGDRADPPNLFQGMGRIAAMLSTLGMKDDQSKELLPKLGLMRGDSDPTIGDPVVNIEDFAEIRCNNEKSSVSTDFGCSMRPRY